MQKDSVFRKIFNFFLKNTTIYIIVYQLFIVISWKSVGLK